MIAGLKVAVECEECGVDSEDAPVFMDECGNTLCQECQYLYPCEYVA